ncbi:MAG: hypothetical protein IR164_00520 [Devosia sp.]|uniref:hypothetical protein n=1 Tax=Devosia sp. TaxID=1871048 RepID=UPI001A0615D6|nr:hypothetical protein [Devosia sp.]MBF0677403.1 hypothetical protein [Devosia sp.]
MADPKETLTPPTDPKPARSAAVKPPVLEGTARPATGDAKSGETKPGDTASGKKPDPAEATKAAGTPPPNPPKPVPPPAPSRPTSSSPGWLAGILGGVIGLGGAYGLAALGYWPAASIEAPAPVADPRVAQISTALPELQTVTDTIQSELSVLTNRVGVLESAPPPETTTAESPVAPTAPAVADTTQLDALSAEISALQARLDDMAAQSTESADVSTDYAAQIAALQSGLSQFEEEANRLRTEIDAIGGRVGTLETEKQASAGAEQNQARLPLILSSFEAAFANGRDYADALRAVDTALPDLTVPSLVAANAASGIKRPEVIAAEFNAILPDMLAARPLEGSEGWQGATADWFRGIIALRPTGEVEGNDPEAIIARLEAALARRDFGAAAQEFSQLPEPMQAAAGSVASDIAAQAEASAFLTDLRQTALSQGGAS